MLRLAPRLARATRCLAAQLAHQSWARSAALAPRWAARPVPGQRWRQAPALLQPLQPTFQPLFQPPLQQRPSLAMGTAASALTPPPWAAPALAPTVWLPWLPWVSAARRRRALARWLAPYWAEPSLASSRLSIAWWVASRRSARTGFEASPQGGRALLLAPAPPAAPCQASAQARPWSVRCCSIRAALHQRPSPWTHGHPPPHLRRHRARVRPLPAAPRPMQRPDVPDRFYRRCLPHG